MLKWTRKAMWCQPSCGVQRSVDYITQIHYCPFLKLRRFRFCCLEWLIPHMIRNSSSVERQGQLSISKSLVKLYNVIEQH